MKNVCTVNIKQVLAIMCRNMLIACRSIHLRKSQLQNVNGSKTFKGIKTKTLRPRMQFLGICGIPMLDKLEKMITRESCDPQYTVSTISITAGEKRAKLGGQKGPGCIYRSISIDSLICGGVFCTAGVPFVNVFGPDMAPKAETVGGLGQ